MRWSSILLIASIGLTSACTTTLRTITADQWDQLGKSQYYVGYWEGNCLGAGGMCFSTRGKMMMCRLRDDNSLDCSEQTSVTEALRAKD